MYKIFSPKFLPKLIIVLLLIAEFGLMIWGVLYLTNIFTDEKAVSVFVIILFVLNTLVDIYIVNSKSEGIYKLTWMFFVNALPLFGILLYLLFANKTTSHSQRNKYERWRSYVMRGKTDEEVKKNLDSKFPEVAPMRRYLQTVAYGAMYQQTSTKYYPIGDLFFPDFLEDLKKAKHFIFLEFFIYAPGKMWDQTLAILEQKAKEGVDVRVIYDDVGSYGTLPYHYDLFLKSRGIHCAVFEPMRPFTDIRLNNRDHRKIIVIDGVVGYSGGCNFADEYINQKVRFGLWKDNMVRLFGRGVEGYTMLFLSTWNSIAQPKPSPKVDLSGFESARYIAEYGGYPESDGFVQPYGDLPYDKEAVGENVYLDLIGKAQKTIYISTPYLILDEMMTKPLVNAAKMGVDVHIVMPHIPDKKAVFHVSRSYYGDLLQGGVHIHEFKPGFVHAKTFLVDGVYATVGSVNLDYRSLYLHLENGTLLVGCSCLADMEKDFKETLEQCEEITLKRWDGWHQRNMTYWAVLRLLTPLM